MAGAATASVTIELLWRLPGGEPHSLGAMSIPMTTERTPTGITLRPDRESVKHDLARLISEGFNLDDAL